MSYVAPTGGRRDWVEAFLKHHPFQLCGICPEDEAFVSYKEETWTAVGDLGEREPEPMMDQDGVVSEFGL